MIPSREEAERIIKEAEAINPGPWGDHCRVAAHCAERIAARCEGMNPDKAYVVGLLHDIGRRFGGRHLGHVADGYSYMMSLGYDEVARICLTHSFNNQSMDGYIGKIDTTEEELKLIQTELAKITMDDYDRLIQLCDSLAGAEGVLDIEERMGDVKRRYGYYPEDKWNINLDLKRYFEDKRFAALQMLCPGMSDDELWDKYVIQVPGLQWEERDFSKRAFELGYHGIAEYHAVHPDIRAVACFTDNFALGVAAWCKDNGLIIGKDIFLAGFNNIEAVRFYPYPISSAAHPVDESIDILLREMDQNQPFRCEIQLEVFLRS